MTADIQTLEREQVLEHADAAVAALYSREPFPLAGRHARPEGTVVDVDGPRTAHRIGGNRVMVMAGPCSVESLTQMRQAARAVKEAGATILRGGAFKPRTSPYSFQGLGRRGLEILAEVGDRFDLAVVTEVMDPENVPLVSCYADILQVGSRNMQNFSLLHAVGESGKPVLLKRGMMSTLHELLLAAEYILTHGNGNVMLCERGIRTFETYTRNTFDLNAIPALKRLTHLPVIADPSHGTGQAGLVSAVSKGAVATGADGLIVEVHPHPERALSDGQQSLTPAAFSQMMAELRPIARAVGRDL